MDVLIVYYSSYGNVYKMAQLVAEGVRQVSSLWLSGDLERQTGEHLYVHRPPPWWSGNNHLDAHGSALAFGHDPGVICRALGRRLANLAQKLQQTIYRVVTMHPTAQRRHERVAAMRGVSSAGCDGAADGVREVSGCLSSRVLGLCLQEPTMDAFTRNDLRRISSMTADPALSVYMPTYRTGRDVRQNATRFKNLVNRAREQLDTYGLASRQIDKLLEDVRGLEADDLWWTNQSDGLVMFIAPEHSERYRLPLELSELITVGKRFYVRPIIPLLQGDGQFYILAVSQKRVRLLEATKFRVEELHPEQLPKDLRSALNVDEYVRTLQQHTGSGQGIAGGMIFHGQGAAGMDVRKRDEIGRFFQLIDAALMRYLGGGERRPLVFAGVDYLFPIFREACNYEGLVEEAVSGNPDELSAAALHEQAWRVMEPRFAAERDAALRRYENATGGDTAEANLPRIVLAAWQGAIDTLFVSPDIQHWGTIDESSGTAAIGKTPTPGPVADELLNYAAVQTLNANGTVFTLPNDQLPAGDGAVALLRYPIVSSQS